MRFAHRISHRLGLPERRNRRIVDDFHRLYYESGRRTWKDTRWLGVRALKTPLDLWIYQELISTVLPALVIETGSAEGGSAYFIASVCQLLARGEVVSVDIEPHERPEHERITYITASSTAPETVTRVAELARDKEPVMVFLDSDHTREHVLAELHAYADFVTPGSYLVVEDTNLNDHPVVPGFGPGPMEAADEFLAERDDFERGRGEVPADLQSPRLSAARQENVTRASLSRDTPVSQAARPRTSSRQRKPPFVTTASVRPSHA